MTPGPGRCRAPTWPHALPGVSSSVVAPVMTATAVLMPATVDQCHLLARGHRRIACLADLPDIYAAGARLAGFRSALDGAAVPVLDGLLRTGLRDDEPARIAMHELLALPEPPTAVFAARNVLSAGAARALQGAGRSHDVALVGFDDFPLSDLLSPALTVVRQDVVRIGEVAADLLLSRLDAAMLGSQEPARTVTLDTALVPRGSGEISPPH